MTGGFIDVVELQTSKSKDRLTLNIGVMVPAVYELCWGKPHDEFVQEPFCTVRTRLFDSCGVELWWLADDRQTPVQMTEELRVQGLPFIDRMHSLKAIEDRLADRAKRPYLPDAVYFALVEAAQGKASEACARLGSLRQQVIGDWRARIDDVMSRLPCS